MRSGIANADGKDHKGGGIDSIWNNAVQGGLDRAYTIVEVIGVTRYLAGHDAGGLDTTQRRGIKHVSFSKTSAVAAYLSSGSAFSMLGMNRCNSRLSMSVDSKQVGDRRAVPAAA
jgi:hypothetical protein